MKYSMRQWQESLIKAPAKKPMPILSFPGVQLIGHTVRETVVNGSIQAACMKAIADRYPTLAAVSNMDLSVEAEAFGAKTVYNDHEVPSITGQLVSSAADVQQLTIPAVGTGRTGETVKAIEIARTLITDRPVFAGVIGPFSLAGRLVEMTEIMYQAVDEPETVHALLEKITLFLTDYVQAFKNAGANGIVMAEPAAGLLSPSWNEVFSADYVKRVVDAVQDDDFLVVYHNCGHVEPLMPAIVDTGALAFHFGNAADLPAVIQMIPSDYLVMGNIDPAKLIAQGTPETIKQATTTLINRMKTHPNFILSSGCDIPPQAPLTNIDAFFEVAGFQLQH